MLFKARRFCTYNILPVLKAKYFFEFVDGVTIRGCAVTLSAEEITECTDDENDQCIYCDGTNCNIELPSAASSLKSILSLLLTVFVAALLSW